MKFYYRALSVKIRNKINIYLFSGNNVICMMCGWKGRKFPKNICPRCKSFARTRLIPYCFNFFSINKVTNILHIAPNLAEYIYVKENISFEKYNRLNLIKETHIDIVGDITNLSIKKNSYDLIIAYHVLEHIPEDIKAISGMHRVLKTGGNLLISVPIFPPNREKTYEDKNISFEDYESIHGHHDHCRSCGLNYYKRFEKLNFHTRTLSVKQLNEKDINKYGLSKSHVAWLFTKIV